MNTINRKNYEIYFIDFLDGTLTHQEKKELMSFLNDNPDLKEELESLSEDTNIFIEKETSQFTDKKRLRKSPKLNSENYTHNDELCIANLEGDLSDHEQKEFDRLLKSDNALAYTNKLYKKTKLNPDLSTVFPGKEKLKHLTPFFLSRKIYETLAYAASLLLLIAIFTNTSTNNTNNYDKYLASRNIYSEINLAAKMPDEPISINESIELDINNLPTATNNLSLAPKIEANKTPETLALKKIEPIYSPLPKKKPPIYAFNKTEKYYYDEQNLQNLFSLSKNNQKLLADISQNKPQNSSGNPDILDLAELGFKGISRLTGKEWKLQRKYDEYGNLEKLGLKSESFLFSTNVNKK
ncbi:MAG: hypothetical protein R6U04_06800 [Bacteroidales bacterium]